ncbi:MAG: Mth938-like domain-containing protein [Pseudomonadota bacterium]
MKLHQDSPYALNRIRGYGPAEIRVNDTVYHQSLIVAPQALERDDLPHSLAQFDVRHLARLLGHGPEIILLGTGPRLAFPPRELLLDAQAQGVGIEVMDTGAACRTFNVLLAEDRAVVALLLLGEA